MSENDPKDSDSAALSTASAELGELDGEKDIVGRILGGKYRIIQRIGGGGMGSVYKAEQTYFDRIVAVKILHSHLCVNKSFLQRFHQEARIMSQVVHPNAVKLFDFGVDGNLPYLVLEFVEGITLKETLTKNGALPLARINRILQQTCSALTAAHALNIVHRDLKPDNIMLGVGSDGKESVRVLDFGIAKVLHNSGERVGSLMTQVGMLMGTPAYISPELAMEKELDPRSDVYSIGVVLYEMLTAEIPFKSSSPLETYIQHIRNTPVPVRRLRPELDIPEQVCDVVMKTLEKNPDDRYQSASELAFAFNAALKTVDPHDLEAVPQSRATATIVDPFRTPPDFESTNVQSVTVEAVENKKPNEVKLGTVGGEEFARKAPKTAIWIGAGAVLLALISFFSSGKFFGLDRVKHEAASTASDTEVSESEVTAKKEEPEIVAENSGELAPERSAEATASATEVESEQSVAEDPTARAMVHAPIVAEQEVNAEEESEEKVPELAASETASTESAVPEESVESKEVKTSEIDSQVAPAVAEKSIPTTEAEQPAAVVAPAEVASAAIPEVAPPTEGVASQEIAPPTEEASSKETGPPVVEEQSPAEIAVNNAAPVNAEIEAKLFAAEVTDIDRPAKAAEASAQAAKYLAAGDKLLDSKDYLNAAIELRKALFLQDSNLQAHLSYGNALMRLGLLEKAAAELDSALKLDPQYAPTHYTLAACYALSNNSDKAFESLENAMKLFPGTKKWLATDKDFDSLRTDPRFSKFESAK